MNKFLFGLIALSAVATVGAPKANALPDWTVILNEDFSGFASGSETSPGNVVEMTNGWHIPARYTSTPGWIGGGLYEAGGACYIGYRISGSGAETPGYISTPEQTIRGAAKVTFRARNAAGHKSVLWVAMIDSESGPRVGSKYFTLTDEWAEYTFTSDEGSLENKSYIQFQAKNGLVVIDDIKIDYLHNRLATPIINNPINNSPSSFTAQWTPTDAGSYKLSVFRLEPEANGGNRGTLKEDWNGLNIQSNGTSIDLANPGYGDGWSVGLDFGAGSQIGSKATEYASGPYSLRLNAVGDSIMSPLMSAPIKKFSMWIKPSVTESSQLTDVSFLQIKVWHEYNQSWEIVAQMPSYWFPAGGIFSLPEDCFREDGTRITILQISKGKADFFIDDVEIEYESKGKHVDIFTDKLLTTSDYTVDDIDPQLNYYYNVAAIDAEGVVSAKSPLAWVDGVRGLTVEPLAPDNVGIGQFTARWSTLPHALKYVVETARIVDATDRAIDNRRVLAEDFSLITTDNRNLPESAYDFGANGMANSHWVATNALWNDGAVASSGSFSNEQPGMIVSPTLNFHGLKSRKLNIAASVVNTIATYGRNKPEALYFLLLPADYDVTNPYQNLNSLRKAAIGEVEIATPTIGSHKVNIELDANLIADNDLSSVKIALTSKSGQAFWLDNFELSVNLAPGEGFTAPLAIATTDADKLSVSGLVADENHAFRVQPMTHRAYKDIYGNFSEWREVKTAGNPAEIKLPDATPTVAIKAVDGGVELTGLTVGSTIRVIAVDGHLAAHTVADASGRMTLPLAPGIYIVSTNNITQKIAIK